MASTAARLQRLQEEVAAEEKKTAQKKYDGFMSTVQDSTRTGFSDAEKAKLRTMGEHYGSSSRALEFLPQTPGETLRPFIQVVEGTAKPVVDSLDFGAAPLQSSMVFNFSQISQEELFAKFEEIDTMLKNLRTETPVVQDDGTVRGHWKIFRSPGLKVSFYADASHRVHLVVASHGGEEMQAHIKALVDQGKTLADIAKDSKIKGTAELLRLNARRLARKIAKRLDLRPAVYVDKWTVHLDPKQARARYLQETHMITTNYASLRPDGTVIIYNGAAAKPSSAQTLVQGRHSIGVAHVTRIGGSLGHPYHTFPHPSGAHLTHASKHTHSAIHYGTRMKPDSTFHRLREF